MSAAAPVRARKSRREIEWSGMCSGYTRAYGLTRAAFAATADFLATPYAFAIRPRTGVCVVPIALSQQSMAIWTHPESRIRLTHTNSRATSPTVHS